MEQTQSTSQVPGPQSHITDIINDLNTRPAWNAWNYHKHRNKFIIISYFLTFSSFIWAVINSYYLSLFFHTKYSFLLILGFLPFLPFSVFFFYLPFFIHRVLRSKTLLVLLITFDTAIAILAVVLKDYVFIITEFYHIYMIITIINVFSIYTLSKQPIRVLLYTVSADILYSVKLLLFKTLFKQVCTNSFSSYYNFAAFLIHTLNFINQINRHHEIYLIVSMVIGMVLFITSFTLNMITRRDEFTIFGYLLCINNTKRKLRIGNNYSELNDDYSEVSDHNNVLSNGLNYLDIKQSLADLKEKEIKEKYFIQPMKPSKFTYGPTPMSGPSADTQQIVSREMIEAFRNSSPGLPLQVFKTEGSFVYSQLDNTDIQQATNKFVTLSFNNGFIVLIKETYADTYNLMTSIITRLNILFITGLSIILYFTKHPFYDTGTVAMCTYILFIFLGASMRLIGTTNDIILGYSNAMLYLLIGGRIELRNELKYERKLKIMLDEVCERDKII